MAEGKAKQKNGAEEIVWDLSDLYSSPEDPALNRDRKALITEAEKFSSDYRGRISRFDPEEFLKALERYEQLVERVRKIGSYAHLIWSTDTGNSDYGKLLQESNELGSEVSQILVFFDVEWLKLDDAAADRIIRSEALQPYRHYLVTSRRYKEHTLEEGQEQVMSAKSVTGRTAWVRFFDELMGRSRYSLDEEELTQQEVLNRLHSSDRDLRERAHASVTSTLRGMEKELAYVFNTVLADKHTTDKLRSYSSWLQSRNLANQIDDSSVEALIGSVQESYPVVQRYYDLKRGLLGLDSMKDFDRYAPIAKSEQKMEWGEAKKLVLDAFGRFHPEMKRVAGLFFEKNWIDAAIRPGKRGGAYSASTVASVHPYVFLNYDGTLRDVQTLAHELGHGVHQYLSRTQGELQASTPLTTAETASVFAEMLVFEELMERLEDPSEQLALLMGKIDDSIATVFRQISMNRFEDAMHTARRSRGELTVEDFSEHWKRTQSELYGDSVRLTDGYSIWWSYIPHFLHTPGYVYAYAFGELLVLSLYHSYKESGDESFADRYIEVLEAGGSDWPHELIGTLDKDIRDSGFWKEGLSVFEQMVSRAESLKREID